MAAWRRNHAHLSSAIRSGRMEVIRRKRRNHQAVSVVTAARKRAASACEKAKAKAAEKANGEKRRKEISAAANISNISGVASVISVSAINRQQYRSISAYQHNGVSVIVIIMASSWRHQQQHGMTTSSWQHQRRWCRKQHRNNGAAAGMKYQIIMAISGVKSSSNENRQHRNWRQWRKYQRISGMA